MLFTCKHFMFSDFTWKKTFAPGSGGDGGGEGGGGLLDRRLPGPVFLYGPEFYHTIVFVIVIFTNTYLLHKILCNVFFFYNLFHPW